LLLFYLFPLCFMQPEITLVYHDETGRLQRAKVESKRFSIGRTPDNDLMIENSSLSRRHALIESFDDAVQLCDCGSSNGTFLNGAPVASPVELHDGDLINLADACDITVEFGNSPAMQAGEPIAYDPASPPLSQQELLRRIEAGLAAQKPAASPTATASASNEPEGKGPFEYSPLSPGLNVHIIAPLVVVVILAFVALAAVVLKSGPANKRETDRQTTKREDPRAAEATSVAELPSPEDSPTGTSDGVSQELEEVERNALAVMRSISKADTNPVLTEQSVKEIDGKIKAYNGSSLLRDNLRVMEQRGMQPLSGLAKSNDVKPAFLIFAALAKMDRDGQRGDPVAVAQGLLPVLTKTRIVFGDELAHDVLLSLAATDPSTGGAIALRDAVANLTKKRPDASPAMIRNVWFLHDNQGISPQAFDLVLRFLAIGAIAQHPNRYGIEAESLTF
jgi:hypothetical protein